MPKLTIIYRVCDSVDMLHTTLQEGYHGGNVHSGSDTDTGSNAHPGGNSDAGAGR